MAESLPKHEEKFIRSYVETESRNADDPSDPDTKVTLVQKVSSYRLMGTDYDVYDVHMPKKRWWVITEPTNLYSQETFPNYDVAFSFHIGLMLRVMNRERVEIEEEKAEEVGAAWRRYEAAVAAMDSAREAEDYQGVAIKCREALLAFGREHQEAEWLTLPEVKCKVNDFKGWAKLYAQELSTGRMRRYLNEIAEKTWDVSVSLQPSSRSKGSHRAGVRSVARIVSSLMAISPCEMASRGGSRRKSARPVNTEARSPSNHGGSATMTRTSLRLRRQTRAQVLVLLVQTVGVHPL
jgi:hypothetical protein